jgi:tRNA threonylcarbamoyladenosine biosynthesis protein TsaB
MKLLALDTATLSASVAAYDAAARRLVAAAHRRVTTHSEALMALVGEVLEQAGWPVAALDGVACGAGPGSFTGLRIGLATAKGLCWSLGRPLLLVSSLEALAARGAGTVAACLDAHKGEVYAGLYTVGEGRPQAVWQPPARALLPEALAAALAVAPPDLLIGDGAQRYCDLLTGLCPIAEDDGAPHAAEVARLAAPRLLAGESDPLAQAAPLYVRPSEAEIVKQKNQGRAE